MDRSLERDLKSGAYFSSGRKATMPPVHLLLEACRQWKEIVRAPESTQPQKWQRVSNKLNSMSEALVNPGEEASDPP